MYKTSINKIFLGDTGSLIIGLTMAVVVVRFLQFGLMACDDCNVPAIPALAIGILIVPLFDTLRVFTVRIAKGRSPFSADRQHVHHKLLGLGMSHLKATMIILSVNILFIVLALLLQDIRSIPLLSMELVLAIVLSFIPVYLLKRRMKTG